MTESKMAYTAIEVAEQLSVHVQTVRLWIRKGILPVVWLGGAKRVRHADLQKLLKEGTPKVWGDKPCPEQREAQKRRVS